ncbi:MAG TPA: ribbon-helix-helix protein, CopG family [Vicinamibacterales bacterium]|nr:ribbon-helix-helix protein, CopG family [Vicinamibacterales bacterium]
MVKLTFTLDDETVADLERTASRLRRPKSQVVREAIREYGARTDRLSDDERTRMLEALDRMIRRPRSRSAAAVKRELAEIRAARRAGGRRNRPE